ncbi:MAG: N-acetylneuraminate synthase [Clostridium sp.]
MSRVFIIGEAGVNHNGDINIAKKLIDIGAEGGVDCIKFQHFKAKNMVTINASLADYQKDNSEKYKNQYDMLKNLELTKEELLDLKKYTESLGLIFLCSPFDIESFYELEEIGVCMYKVASSEINNYPLLKEICKTNKKIILSTGMANFKEVSDTVEFLRENGENNIALLHCTSNYPTPVEEVNLLSINSLKTLGVEVGYSDHTKGEIAAIGALAMGATIIEKHFTFNKESVGPDHKASLNGDELKEFVHAIREFERMLGNALKEPSDKEKEIMKVGRKSIVAMCKIKKGEGYTVNNIGVKRPGGGISPSKYYEVLGKLSNRDYEADELIKDDVNGE